MYKKLAKFYTAAALLIVIAMLAACGTTPTPTPISGATESPVPTTPRASYDFRNGAQGWVAGFADYPPGEEQFYELDSGIRDLPAGLEPTGTGYYTAGNNHSDDLFMFLKRKLGAAEGVQPGASYRLKVKVVLASNVPSGCSGIGGAPGEGVTLKAGASNVEPNPIVQDGMYVMNLDKGQQASGGPAGEVIGDVANSVPCEQAVGGEAPYVSVTKEHSAAMVVKSSDSAELWLLIGSDSGFEGSTALYYQQIEFELLTAR